MFHDMQVPYASIQKMGYISFEYIVTGEGNVRVEVKEHWF